MSETIYMVILAISIGVYHSNSQPVEYELNMANGTNTQIVLQNNNKYACPLYCEVDHIHIAVTCNDNCNTSHNNFHLHNFMEVDNGFATFCSQKILTMSKISTKGKLPAIVAASEEK